MAKRFKELSEAEIQVLLDKARQNVRKERQITEWKYSEGRLKLALKFSGFYLFFSALKSTKTAIQFLSTMGIYLMKFSDFFRSISRMVHDLKKIWQVHNRNVQSRIE